MSNHSSFPLWLENIWEHVCDRSITNLGRVDAEILERIESDEDVAHVSVHLQLIIPLLEMADYYLLQERKKTPHTWHQQDCTLDRSMHDVVNTLNLTSSKNSRFTRSSSGQLSIMRVLRVLIRSCLYEAKDMIMPQKAVKWPPNEKQ